MELWCLLPNDLFKIVCPLSCFNFGCHGPLWVAGKNCTPTFLKMQAFIIYLFGYFFSGRSTSMEILSLWTSESHFYIYTGSMLFLAEVGWTIWASFSCRLLTSFEIEEEMHSRAIQPFEIWESGQDALWYWFVISFVQTASTYNTMWILFRLRCLVVIDE